ncbi:MAG: hypothetical protein AMS15_08275 [Planctomycetes bacterium DG_23]|nr:MAG: hypothetical protein AMS15_08275 [Planctomycetes bacterium DG_23]
MAPTQIVHHPTFSKQVKRLKKRFRSIENDVAKAEQAIKVNPRFQTRVQGYGSLEVYKIRVVCSDIPHGRSKGYRIYYLYQPEIPKVTFLTIYHKSDRADVNRKEINQLIEGLG